jgi:hypothetical protein
MAIDARSRFSLPINKTEELTCAASFTSVTHYCIVACAESLREYVCKAIVWTVALNEPNYFIRSYTRQCSFFVPLIMVVGRSVGKSKCVLCSKRGCDGSNVFKIREFLLVGERH